MVSWRRGGVSIQYFDSPETAHVLTIPTEASKEGAELMLKYGLEYDHSFSHHDSQPYYLRTGDEWDVINFKQHPDTWMKPLRKGQHTGLVEIGASWYLDDLPPLMFIKGSHNSQSVYL